MRAFLAATFLLFSAFAVQAMNMPEREFLRVEAVAVRSAVVLRSHADLKRWRQASRRGNVAVIDGKHFAIRQMVDAAAHAAGVPLKIAHAVVRHESGYKPWVRGKAAEYGLGQIKCPTARAVGFTGACPQLFDPQTNLRYSMRYLKLALDRGGVAYYNAGIHARRLPKAALLYARKVTRWAM